MLTGGLTECDLASSVGAGFKAGGRVIGALAGGGAGGALAEESANLRGGSGAMVQGYTAGVGLMTGNRRQVEEAVAGIQAAQGERGWAAAVGNYIADEWYWVWHK